MPVENHETGGVAARPRQAVGEGARVTAVFAGYPDVFEQINAESLRALAVASLSRIAPLPNLQTVAESGFKDFEAEIWNGIVAPAKTPKETVTQLAGLFTAALQDPETERKLVHRGYFQSAFAARILAPLSANNMTITDVPFARRTSGCRCFLRREPRSWAEVELSHEHQRIDLPPWIGEEVTDSLSTTMAPWHSVPSALGRAAAR
jgi:Tripartite tricarboxylate transporter family receptor